MEGAFPNGKPSEAAALSAAASIGKQQLFFDCVHFWAVSQPLWEPFTHGKPSEAAALSAAASIGKQQLFFDCVHFWAVSQALWEPFAGGKSAGNSRSFGECVPRQAVPTALGAACFLRIFLL